METRAIYTLYVYLPEYELPLMFKCTSREHALSSFYGAKEVAGDIKGELRTEVRYLDDLNTTKSVEKESL